MEIGIISFTQAGKNMAGQICSALSKKRTRLQCGCLAERGLPVSVDSCLLERKKGAYFCWSCWHCSPERGSLFKR